MSFEPHYINTYLIYCMICMIFTILIIEICNKLGDMLEEILQMNEKQLQDNLEKQ